MMIEAMAQLALVRKGRLGRPKAENASLIGPTVEWNSMRQTSATAIGAMSMGSRNETRNSLSAGTLAWSASAIAKPMTYWTATEQRTMAEVVTTVVQKRAWPSSEP